MSLGSHVVPGLWRYLLPADFFFLRFPTEVQSTCHNCPKVAAEGFHPSYRCCTYNPRVPNFLLGMALNDPTTAPLVQEAIKAGFATPDGLQQTPHQLFDSLEQNASGKFGRDALVVCRFLDLDKKQCQLYAYRNSVCATFFCINDHDKEGRKYWERVQALVGQIEFALSQWLMQENGIPADRYVRCLDEFAKTTDAFARREDKSWPPELLKELWGPWYGREAEFFQACTELAQQRQDNLFELACGVELQQPFSYETLLRASLPARLQNELDSEGPTCGEPIAIEDLWYMLQKAHHDLWQPSSIP